MMSAWAIEKLAAGLTLQVMNEHPMGLGYPLESRVLDAYRLYDRIWRMLARAEVYASTEEALKTVGSAPAPSNDETR